MTTQKLNMHSTAQHARALSSKVASVFLLCSILASQAIAGTGNSGAVGARVTNVVSGFQSILMGIGVALLSAAFLYVGYGMAFNGKKWSDVANVAYGATIAGMGSMLVGWLFS